MSDVTRILSAIEHGDSLGFTPTARESFTIVQSTAPIVGTFQGLPQGGSVTIGGVPFTISYTGGASGDDVNPSQASPRTESVSAAAGGTTDGPRIVSMLRYGYQMMPTVIVLTFDQALDVVTAEDAKDYRIIGHAGRTIAIKKAVYNPAALTVTLYPVQRVSIHHSYKLIVDGTSPHGLTNTRGQLLDGANTGSPDSDYRAPLTWRNLVLDPPPAKAAQPSKT